jgi:hypothetical protein
MSTERLVQVEYERPDTGLTLSIGLIRESPEHLILIQQWAMGYHICNYIVIPKSLVKKTVDVNLK